MDNLKMMQTIYKNDHFKKLIDMIKNVDDTHECEVSINRSEGITISQYIDIAKYFSHEAMIPEIQGITPFAFHNYWGSNKK